MSFADSVGMRLRGAYLTMHRRFQTLFAAYGVTADQFVVLSLLADEDRITQKELTQRTRSDANTIVAMLRLLEQKKLIRRENDAQDGRARRVCLTSRGRTLQVRLAEASTELHSRLVAAAGGANADRFIATLDAIAVAMTPDSTPKQKSTLRSSR